ncbi:MAG TPA: DUF6049 family protein, partial [Pseudonocardiaceae bacterium]|nr:DUF6049 family protein [Pseudonocardiaceae bacterium]
MRKLAVWALVVTALLAPVLTAAPAGAAPPPAPAQAWLRLSLHSMTPAVVTSTSTSVTVTGTITNISDRRISQLTARLQLADPVSDGADIPADLAPTAVYSHSDTLFTPLIDSLSPGQSTSFTVHEQLRGPQSLRV